MSRRAAASAPDASLLEELELAFTRRRAAARIWWGRHHGLDGAIRVGGAVAVVVTIEALGGYFLWIGMTTQVRVPDMIGWTLQVALAGGSAVGTRAFHRGRGKDRWWGIAASVLAIGCLVFDASVFALLVHGQVDFRPGTLAVVALCQCLAVGYLTVHTLMAAPRVAGQPVVGRTSERPADPATAPVGVALPGGQEEPRTEEVPLPPPNGPEGEQDTQEDDSQDDSQGDDGQEGDEDEQDGRRDPDHRLIPWNELSKEQAQAEARRLTTRGHRITQSRKTLDQLRAGVRDARIALGEPAA